MRRAAELKLNISEVLSRIPPKNPRERRLETESGME